jgi:uncharacterized protein (TIGR02453 family)
MVHMAAESSFEGFPAAGLRFLADLRKNNNKKWFDARKEIYRESLMEPAQVFVVALGDRLREISGGIISDPRLNGSGSLMRIYRDTRFSADKSPYKNWLGIFFWEGVGKKNENPGFFMRIEADGAFVGCGKYLFPRSRLGAYRNAVADSRKGRALAGILESFENDSILTLGGETYKRVPSGYNPDHPRADLLRNKGLFVYVDKVPRKELLSPGFVDICYDWCRKMSPLYNWLKRYVADAE